MKTWHFAQRDLQIAKKVLIVGYSFPPLDAFATVRLRDALTSGAKEITYVCPWKPDCERVQALLDLPQSAIIEDCWKPDHFNRLLALPSLQPSVTSRSHRGKNGRQLG